MGYMAPSTHVRKYTQENVNTQPGIRRTDSRRHREVMGRLFLEVCTNEVVTCLHF